MSGKRLRAAAAAVEAGRLYPLEEAVRLVRETATAKFAESVDLSVNLGIDPRQSDQNLRGAAVLPHGLGKEARVAVFAGGDPAHEAQFFLGVAFPDRRTRILAYNRTVANLAGRTAEQFLAALRERFPVAAGPPVPRKGSLAMYLAGAWHAVDLAAAAAEAAAGGPAARLDAAILQDRILAPVLAVADVRTDPRMTFVGGARGVGALERAVDSGAAAVAFSLAPVTPDELLAVSDAGGVMPPKSTWFEPKLRDGLLIHTI